MLKFTKDRNIFCTKIADSRKVRNHRNEISDFIKNIVNWFYTYQFFTKENTDKLKH